MAGSLAARYGSQAQIEAVNRAKQRDIFAIESESRRALFGVLGQLLGIGSSLYENAMSNRELMEFAKDKGLQVESGKFANIFGTPSFSLAGEDVSKQQILTLQALEDFNKSQNLLNILNRPIFNDSPLIDTTEKPRDFVDQFDGLKLEA